MRQLRPTCMAVAHAGNRKPGEDGYFEHVRAELLDLFDHAPRRFVDIGCSTGVTAREAKRRFPGAVVDGFEFSAAAAAIAATHLDHVHQGNVEEMDFAQLGYAPQSIDGLLLADVAPSISTTRGTCSCVAALSCARRANRRVDLNARNLVLLNDLANGKFSYEPAACSTSPITSSR